MAKSYLRCIHRIIYTLFIYKLFAFYFKLLLGDLLMLIIGPVYICTDRSI